MYYFVRKRHTSEALSKFFPSSVMVNHDVKLTTLSLHTPFDDNHQSFKINYLSNFKASW